MSIIRNAKRDAEMAAKADAYDNAIALAAQNRYEQGLAKAQADIAAANNKAMQLESILSGGQYALPQNINVGPSAGDLAIAQYKEQNGGLDVGGSYSGDQYYEMKAAEDRANKKQLDAINEEILLGKQLAAEALLNQRKAYSDGLATTDVTPELIQQAAQFTPNADQMPGETPDVGVTNEEVQALVDMGVQNPTMEDVVYLRKQLSNTGPVDVAPGLANQLGR